MFDDSVYSSLLASMNSWFTPTVLFVLLNVMIGTIAFTSSLASHNHQQDHSQQQPQQQPKLTPSPSILQRIKSINLYNTRSIKNNNLNFVDDTEPTTTTLEPQTHYIFEHNTIETETTTNYVFNQSHHQQPQTHYQPETHYEPHQEPETEPLFVYQPKHENNEPDVGSTHSEDEGELKSLDEVYSELSERHVSRSRSDTKPYAGEAPAKLPAKMRKSASMKSPFGHFEEEDIVEARRPATARVAGEGDNEVDVKADDFINKFKQQLKLQRLDSILRYKEMIGSRGTHSNNN